MPFVVVIHAYVSCIYAYFKVFPVLRLLCWISGMGQIWFEGTNCSQYIEFRKRRKVHPLIPSGLEIVAK